MKNKRNNKLLVTGISLILVIGILVVLCLNFWPKGEKGSKHIDVTVTYADQSNKEFNIDTDEEFLRGALEQENLIQGTESEFGLFVQTVDKVTVDATKEEWWSFTKGGAFLESGVDTTPISDGDTFEITLTVGYQE